MTKSMPALEQNKAAVEQLIAQYNEIYTTVVHGGKNYVLRLNTDAFSHNYIEFFSHKEFIDAHRDAPKLKVMERKWDGSYIEKQVNPAKYWLDSSNSASAKFGITFHPAKGKYHMGKFNAYMGRGCEPIKCNESDVALYLEHVRTIICDNDNTTYQYVVNWLAHLIQKPEQKPEVAIVLKAGQGTGKGTFVDPIGKIIGSHYLHAQSPEQVIGKFNAQLENKLLVFADEFFAGSKGATDRLKTMITERVNTIERKGQDRITVPCFARIIMATNHENVIKIERDERRYLYLEVSEDKKQDKEYFTKLRDVIDHRNFASKLYYYLKNLDISTFNPREVPKTSALVSQKIDNLEPLDKWIYTILRDGSFSTNTPWPARLPSPDIHQAAERWVEANHLNVWGDIPRKVGRLMSKLGASKTRIRDGNDRAYYTDLPELTIMRSLFEQYINADIAW